MGEYGVKVFGGLDLVSSDTLLDESGNKLSVAYNVDLTSGQLVPNKSYETVSHEYIKASVTSYDDYFVTDEAWGFKEWNMKHKVTTVKGRYYFCTFPDYLLP